MPRRLPGTDPTPELGPVPARAAPPLLLQVSDNEILRDDTLRYARAVAEAGGSVQVERWREMAHVFQVFAPLIPEEWLPAAVGTPEECARYWQSELEHGADSVCIHGSTAAEFAPALKAFAALRDS